MQANTKSLVHRTLSSDLRALFAVAWKEWRIFRRYATWLLAVFVWPVLLPFGYIFTARALGGPQGTDLAAFERATGTTDYIAYIAIGTLLWGWLSITLWDIGFQLRNEQMRGTLESNWLAPTWRISLMVGSSLTKLVFSLLFLLITVIEFRLIFGVNLVQGDPLLLLLILVLLVPSVYAIGIAFASLVIYFKEASAMVFLVRGLFMIFCGITYPIDVLPAWMQTIASLLPLTYAIRAMRSASLLHASFADLAPDLARLALFAVLTPIIAWVTFSLTEREARRTGSLSHY